jgi:hypothetical protein
MNTPLALLGGLLIGFGLSATSIGVLVIYMAYVGKW